MGKYCLSEPFGLSRFTPPIVSQGQTPLRVDAVEHGSESSDYRSGSCMIHFCQCDKERASLNQSTNGGRIARTLDQIALPMARHDAVFDFRRAHMDADHVRNGAAPIWIPSARPPTLTSLAQAGDLLGTQLTARHGVECGVDGLMADLERRVVRLHSAQYERDLFRRMPIARQSYEVAPQWADLGRMRWVSCRSRQSGGALLRKRCAIATGQQWTNALLGTRWRVGPAVAFQLMSDRTRRRLQAARNFPQRAALLKAQPDQRAYFTAQVFILRSQGNTLSPDKCCTSYLRPPTMSNYPILREKADTPWQ